MLFTKRKAAMMGVLLVAVVAVAGLSSVSVMGTCFQHPANSSNEAEESREASRLRKIEGVVKEIKENIILLEEGDRVRSDERTVYLRQSGLEVVPVTCGEVAQGALVYVWVKDQTKGLMANVLVIKAAKKKAQNSFEAAIDKELTALAGTWRIVRSEENGRTIPQRELTSKDLIIKPDGTAILDHPVMGKEEIRLKIDPTLTPKFVTYLYKDNNYWCESPQQRGIYKRKGDKLTVCLTPIFDGSRYEYWRVTLPRAEYQVWPQYISNGPCASFPNPKTDFTTAGTNYQLSIYERVKKP